MKRLLKIKFAWFPVWLVPVLMLVMLSVYLPVFSGGTQRLTDFPLIIVNEDESFAQSALGKQITDSLVNQSGGNSIDWTVNSSKEEALDHLKDNKADGAIVIPADFSIKIKELGASLATGKDDAKPAQIEVLINEGSGQLPTSVATSVLQQLAGSISTGVVSQLTAELSQNKVELSPTAAALLEKPIQITTTNALQLPANVNKGMSPFMMVLISSITAFMTTQMVHGFLNNIVSKMRSHGVQIKQSTALFTEFLLSLIMVVGMSVLIPLFVFGVFGSTHTGSIFEIWLFTLFSVTTMFFMFKAISLISGKWGMLVMFPINIIGIFASGGAIALPGLPAFHRICSMIFPTRYMVDGLRSLIYYHGNIRAGLGMALIVITIYFAVFVSVNLMMIFNAHRKDSDAKLEANAPIAGTAQA